MQDDNDTVAGNGRAGADDDDASDVGGPAGRRDRRAPRAINQIASIPQVNDEVGEKVREGFADFLEK